MGTWSEEQLDVYGASHHLYINPMIYAEISIGFSRIEDLEQPLMEGGFNILPIPREAIFLAGKTFLQHRKRKGTKRSPLPDFYIGTHAAIEGFALLTRNPGGYLTYFSHVVLLGP